MNCGDGSVQTRQKRGIGDSIVNNNSDAIIDKDDANGRVVDELVTGDISFDQQGAAALVTLDRPKALNALNDGMRSEFPDHLISWASDPEIYAMIIRSGNARAFCVGGDVRELHANGLAGTALASLAYEYKLNWLLDRFTKPTIALIDGMVMGSGVGISRYATHRVAGANYSFAMPEVAIGFFPDVGATWFLSHLNNGRDAAIGTYLGLTGARLGRADAYALGLATHCIDGDKYSKILSRLGDADPVDPVLDDLHEDPGEGELMGVRHIVQHCFSAPTVEEIISRLHELSDEHLKWRTDTLALMGRASPISLKVTLKQLRAGRELDLRGALSLEYRLAAKFMEGSDFYEGVRANLIDKDFEPDWQCKELSDVADELVDGYFSHEPDEVFELGAPSDADVSNS